MTAGQLNLFQGLVSSEGDASALDDYISKIQQIRDTQNLTSISDEAFNAAKIESYANALKNLTSEQQALILSTQGLSTAQIQQVLAAKKAEDGSAALTAQAQYQAMAEAGLLTSKRSLTEAEMAETVQTVFGTDADVAQTMAKIGATLPLMQKVRQLSKSQQIKLPKLSLPERLQKRKVCFWRYEPG